MVELRCGKPTSNSVTSFFIYGACFDGNDTESLLKAASRLGFDISAYAEGFYPYELLPEIAGKLGLEDHYGQSCERYYVGLSPYLIGDNETGSQFRTRVEEKIIEAFGVDIKCAYYEESFRDDLEIEDE